MMRLDFELTRCQTALRWSALDAKFTLAIDETAAYNDANDAMPMRRIRLAQACSSMAERCCNMAEVGGSIPSAPTTPDHQEEETEVPC